VLGGWTALHTLDLAYGTLSVLPASLGAQQHLTRLDATNSCLLHLPMDLMCLPRLEVLVLRNTRLWEWPASLFLAGCPALRHLEIDCCRGASLPGALGCLTGLTALRLVDTTTSTVMSLPKGMSALGQLQVLDISFLSLVPAAGWEVLEALAPTLRSLTARHMGWERLPAPLYTLTRLTYLDLSGTPLVEVGEELRGLTALQHLNLGTCQLGEMPACLAALPVLRVLHMRGNPLVAPSAHAVPPTQLQELTLPFCYTTNLAGLVQSTGLTRLVLRGNNLVSLQGAARLPSLPLLRHLDLSHNRLRNLKGLGPTPQLATLCLDFNRRLTCLTGLQLLGPLLGLRKLRLRGAAIRGGRGLGRHPGKLAALTALGPCPQLAYLDLRNNHLTGLTAEVWAWLAQQPRLAVLCLAGNCWAPDLGLWAPPVLPALQLLDLSACNLRTLPAWLPTLPACDTIQIRGNGGLDDVQAAEVLAAMPGLRQVACQFDLPPQLSHVEAMQPEHYDDEEEEAQEPAQLIV
jgi:Leucine-rich repeat (LRR) protein